MSASPDLLLPPLLGVEGRVRLPGSKSISNRVLLLAALSEGTTRIENCLASDDTARMMEALTALGIDCRTQSAQGDEAPAIVITGCGGVLPVREADLFLGNAGTAFRPLTAVLALAGGHYRLHGTARMHERPIGDLLDALRSLGAQITCTGNEGYPPLTIAPHEDNGAAQVRVRGTVSSQFVSALLMALPLLRRPVTLVLEGETISRPYIALTLALARRFGMEIEEVDANTFRLPGTHGYRSPGTLHVEGDASSASYFLAAGAIGGGTVRVDGVGAKSIQGDVRFADALATMGARIEIHPRHMLARPPENGRLRAFDLDLNHIPDAAMTLAVAALFADGPCRLRNIASWRVKETDRLAAMRTELRKLGAQVQEDADALTITPPAHLRAAAIDTYDDHRMAMCFSLATLGGVDITIRDPACVNKTFPEYFRAFAAISRPVPVIAIDGPAASGKGTVAAAVAKALGYTHLDSGALYRLVALAAQRQHIAADDEEALARIARELPARFEQERVWLENDDVTDAIREEGISQLASQISAHGRVRSALFQRQRDFRAAPGLVAEGRDMGSVIFPDATHKFFLTASVEARAQRRTRQAQAMGFHANIDSLRREIAARDAQDAARAHAPLKHWPDAQLVDTTEMDIDTAVRTVLQSIQAAPV